MYLSEILKNKSVLIVEDDDFARDALVHIIRRVSKSVLFAENGKVGLELFKNNEVDLIITDIEMPILNGFKMIQEIRKISEQIPIVVMSAYAPTDELLKSINSYITKPVDKELLINAMKDIF